MGANFSSLAAAAAAAAAAPWSPDENVASKAHGSWGRSQSDDLLNEANLQATQHFQLQLLKDELNTVKNLLRKIQGDLGVLALFLNLKTDFQGLTCAMIESVSRHSRYLTLV